MFRTPLFCLSLVAATLAGCDTTDDPTTEAAEANDVSAVTEQVVKAPDGCRPIFAIARPIAAPQYHDPALQQTAGRLTLRVGRGEVQTGTILATIVGKSADGSLQGNHDALFAGIGFRTRNDRVVATPTSDPCVFDASTDLYVVEGTGPLAGFTGTLHGTGFVNFCGGEGRVEIAGYVCQTGGGQ
jgi:hypothetical protein